MSRIIVSLFTYTLIIVQIAVAEKKDLTGFAHFVILMGMKKITKIIIVFCILFSFLIPVFAQSGGSLPRVDRTAVLKPDLNQTIMGDYWVLVFGSNPFLRFRPAGQYSPNLAAYNWKEQYWLANSDPSFDKSQVDLTQLFESILLTPEELDREYPGNELVQALEEEPRASVPEEPVSPASPVIQEGKAVSTNQRANTNEPPPANPYRVDPNARLIPGLNGTNLGGYVVFSFGTSPVLRFRAPGQYTNLANYNWKLQCWIGAIRPEFDKSKVDLTQLYSAITLGKEELDRPYSQQIAAYTENQTAPATPSIPTPPETPAQPSGPLIGPGQPAPDPTLQASQANQNSTPGQPAAVEKSEEVEEDYKIDYNAEVRSDLDGTLISGYLIEWVPSFGLVRFLNPQNKQQLGEYNYVSQHWRAGRIDPAFNRNKPNIDLIKLFESITLSPEELNREYPAHIGILDLDKTTGQTASSVADLNDFIAYCRRTGADASYIRHIQTAAGVRGMRGALYNYPTGLLLDINRYGMQPAILCDPGYRTMSAYQRRSAPKYAVGGMQYYFELHHEDFILPTEQGLRIVKDNRVVPVHLIELVPQNGTGTQGILRGRALADTVKKDLDNALGKETAVELITETINYPELLNHGRFSIQYHFDKILEERINSHHGDDALKIYYMTDSDRYTEVDGDGGISLSRGVITTDWNSNKGRILACLGLSIGLRIHSENRTIGTFDLGDPQVSTGCIMNNCGHGRTEVFCPLCKYALGIE